MVKDNGQTKATTEHVERWAQTQQLTLLEYINKDRIIWFV